MAIGDGFADRVLKLGDGGENSGDGCAAGAEYVENCGECGV